MKLNKNIHNLKKEKKLSWEYPICDICGGVSFSVLFEKASYWQHRGEFRIVTCSDCGLVFVHPRPSQSDIGQYYPKELYWGQNIAKKFLESFLFALL